MKKILVVDDEITILKFLAEFLSLENFEVTIADNGINAILKVKEFKPDLILLDVMMPGMDGFDTCKKIREISPIPIIFLTAKSDSRDKIMGLTCGGDDYVIKPFDSAELLLRIRAVLRRSGSSEVTAEEIAEVSGLTVNKSARTVKKREKEIELTVTEFNLLWHLINHPKRVFTREQLAYQVWNSNPAEDTGMINAAIKRLREKIEDNPSDPFYIRTIRGVGYKFGI